MINTKSNKKAFTLAEVLVTLGIIGILASVLMPILSKNSGSKSKIMTRKSYYIVKNTINLLISNPEYYPSADLLKNTAAAGGSGTQNKFCYLFRSMIKNTDETLTCPAADSTDVTHFARTADGMDWYFKGGDFSSSGNFYYNNYIIVDTDIKNKQDCVQTDLKVCPEEYTCSKDCSAPDTFAYAIKYDGRINISTLGETVLQNVLSDSSDIKRSESDKIILQKTSPDQNPDGTPKND